MAAEDVIGSSAVQAVETSANRLVPGLSDEPAWPTLRGHLLLLAAAGADPVAELLTAAATQDLTSAHDQAAVIDSRIHDVNEVTAGGLLPWLPGFPHRLAADPNWGPYLNARSQLVAERADQVRRNAAAEAPAWAAQPHTPVPAELIADLQVWRAATQVDPSDLRPTGPPQLGRAARILQQQLDERLAARIPTQTSFGGGRSATEVPGTTADSFLPELQERLTNLTRAGFDATQLLRSAAAAGPLPGDHPAAALWWRILDQLPQTSNQDHANPEAIPAASRMTPRPFDQRPPVPRLAPPPAFGPSR